MAPSQDLVRECLEWACRDEATHNLIVTLLDRGLDDPEAIESLYLVALRRGAEITAIALRTGAFPKLSISATADLQAIDELAARVHDEMPDLPCVLGPEREARRFAQAWRSRTATEPVRGRLQRIYRLDRVTPGRPVPGALRPAQVAELELLADWVAAFNEDLGEPRQERAESLEAARRYVGRGGVHIWQDQQPVSLVNASGPTGRVARVGPVYTPPEFRRRGYAGAAVAAISQLMLDHGHPLCCLYTDRSNPTSNHIYQEVGYLPACEVEEYWLRAA